jgi:hypothetical protein
MNMGLYLFTDHLFNKAANSSHYTVLNSRPINEQWIWKDVEGTDEAIMA